LKQNIQKGFVLSSTASPRCRESPSISRYPESPSQCHHRDSRNLCSKNTGPCHHLLLVGAELLDHIRLSRSLVHAQINSETPRNFIWSISSGKQVPSAISLPVEVKNKKKRNDYSAK